MIGYSPGCLHMNLPKMTSEITSCDLVTLKSELIMYFSSSFEVRKANSRAEYDLSLMEMENIA